MHGQTCSAQQLIPKRAVLFAFFFSTPPSHAHLPRDGMSARESMTASVCSGRQLICHLCHHSISNICLSGLIGKDKKEAFISMSSLVKHDKYSAIVTNEQLSDVSIGGQMTWALSPHATWPLVKADCIRSTFSLFTLPSQSTYGLIVCLLCSSQLPSAWLPSSFHGWHVTKSFN